MALVGYCCIISFQNETFYYYYYLILILDVEIHD